MKMTRRDLLRAMVTALAAIPGRLVAAPSYKLLFVTAFGGPPPNAYNRRGMLTALGERGLVEGKNLELQFVDPWSPGPEAERQQDEALARAVARRPDAILVQTTSMTRAVQRVTRSTPIVFWNVADPVASGIVTNLARPGGNTTGTTVHNLTLFPKRLQLLREVLPRAKRVALVVDSTFVQAGFPPAFYRQLRDTGGELGLELVEVDVSAGPIDPAAALDVAATVGADAVMGLGPWPSRNVLQGDFVGFQNRNRIPVLGIGSDSRGGVGDGLLLQFGVDVQETFRICAAQLAQIFAGTPPGDIPVEQQSKIDLVVNLKVARELGIAIPKHVLKRADRVIE